MSGQNSERLIIVQEQKTVTKCLVTAVFVSEALKQTLKLLKLRPIRSFTVFRVNYLLLKCFLYFNFLFLAVSKNITLVHPI